MKIVSLCGLLGYGYSEAALNAAFSERVDYLGVDAGSTDPGPYYLGSGKSFTARAAVKRDLALAMPLAIKNKTPFIIGTAGGAGSREHVEWLLDIIREIASEKELSFEMGVVYSDVDREYLREKLRGGKIIPMSPRLPLTEADVDAAERVVSQIGVEPVIELLKRGVDVIVMGRACDTAIYAAPCIYEGYDPALAFHMAKIMECGAMCAEPVAAADVMQAYIYPDCFELRPASPERSCKWQRAAAHTMYEQTNPYMIYEPDGEIDLSECVFEQKDERTVKIYGARFRAAEKKTLKLEGVRLAGYRTIAVAGIYDRETIRRFPYIKSAVEKFVRESSGLRAEDYTLTFKAWGGEESSLGVVIDAVGRTEEIADTVCSLARSRMLHCDYEGRKSSAGNLAFPFSPSDAHMGEVYEFCVFCLAEVDSLSETARTVIERIGK